MAVPNPGATRNSYYYIWIPGMRQGASRPACPSEAFLHVCTAATLFSSIQTWVKVMFKAAILPFRLSFLHVSCCLSIRVFSINQIIHTYRSQNYSASKISRTFDPPGLPSLAGFDTQLELGLCWHPPLLSPLSCSQQMHHGLAAH